MTYTVTVGGSWGSLNVDAATGVILDASHNPLTPEDEAAGERGYRDIALFDPVPFARWGYAYEDILACGYWLRDGTYVAPLTTREADDPRFGRLVEDWVPLALLPAPEPTPEALVIVHAWQWEEPAVGEPYQSYATPGVDPVHGWCIYRRIPAANDWEPFDVADEQDFLDRDSAIAAARTVAAVYGATLCVED